MSEAFKNILKSNVKLLRHFFQYILDGITLVFLGCNVEDKASSMSDKTLVNFKTLESGSSESFLFGLLSLNLSDGFDRK